MCESVCFFMSCIKSHFFKIIPFCLLAAADIILKRCFILLFFFTIFFFFCFKCTIYTQRDSRQDLKKPLKTTLFLHYVFTIFASNRFEFLFFFLFVVVWLSIQSIVCQYWLVWLVGLSSSSFFFLLIFQIASFVLFLFWFGRDWNFIRFLFLHFINSAFLVTFACTSFRFWSLHLVVFVLFLLFISF